jgi:Holliday junction DNA helicase RuvB
MAERIVEAEPKDEDREAEGALRPRWLGEFCGQAKVKEKLTVFLEAAKGRREPLDHVLLSGPPGLGKTTLAHVIANEMGAQIRCTSGPAIERQGDMAAILTNLDESTILFVDEVHRLPRAVEEILYPAMEDFHVDVVLGKGPSARSLRLGLQRFTLVGATTRSGLLSSPLRERFGIVHNLEFYSVDELTEIVMRSAGILGVPIDPEGAGEIGARSRGTARLANRFLRRVRDFAQVRSDGSITLKVAQDALALLEIDSAGLDAFDRRFLRLMLEKFGGGPVGVETLAASLGEERDILEEVCEPYLLHAGLIARTPRGRVATSLAYTHLGISVPDDDQGRLL